MVYLPVHTRIVRKAGRCRDLRAGVCVERENEPASMPRRDNAPVIRPYREHQQPGRSLRRDLPVPQLADNGSEPGRLAVWRHTTCHIPDRPARVVGDHSHVNRLNCFRRQNAHSSATNGLNGDLHLTSLLALQQPRLGSYHLLLVLKLLSLQGQLTQRSHAAHYCAANGKPCRDISPCDHKRKGRPGHALLSALAGPEPAAFRSVECSGHPPDRLIHLLICPNAIHRCTEGSNIESRCPAKSGQRSPMTKLRWQPSNWQASLGARGREATTLHIRCP